MSFTRHPVSMKDCKASLNCISERSLDWCGSVIRLNTELVWCDSMWDYLDKLTYCSGFSSFRGIWWASIESLTTPVILFPLYAMELFINFWERLNSQMLHNAASATYSFDSLKPTRYRKLIFSVFLLYYSVCFHHPGIHSIT